MDVSCPFGTWADVAGISNAFPLGSWTLFGFSDLSFLHFFCRRRAYLEVPRSMEIDGWVSICWRISVFVALPQWSPFVSSYCMKNLVTPGRKRASWYLMYCDLGWLVTTRVFGPGAVWNTLTVTLISDGRTGTVHTESIIFILIVCPSGVAILPST